VTLLSALAGVTTKLRLGVGCMATFVHRHPVMLAHQWASLDVLSSGRTLLAVCLGGPSEANAAQAAEHDVMSIASAERVGRLEEGIEVLRKLFAGKNVSHHGRFYTFADVTLEPRPLQQPCPIWIASNPTGLTWKGGASASDAVVERSFRRIARHADGWMTNKLSPDEFRQQWSRIGAMAREEGRDPATLERTVAVLVKFPGAPGGQQGYSNRPTVEAISGEPAVLASALRAFAAEGISHLQLVLDPITADSIAALAPTISLLDADSGVVQ